MHGGKSHEPGTSQTLKLSVSVPCFMLGWKSPWVVITQGLGFTYISLEIGQEGGCLVVLCSTALGPDLYTIQGQASDSIHRANFRHVIGAS